MKVIVMLSLICVTQAFPGGAPPLIKNFMQMASGDGASNAAQIISMQSITNNCGSGGDCTATTPSGDGGSTPGGNGGSTPGGNGGSTPGGNGGSTPGGNGGSTPGGNGGSTPGGNCPGSDGPDGSKKPADPALVLTVLEPLLKVVVDSLKLKLG